MVNKKKKKNSSNYRFHAPPEAHLELFKMGVHMGIKIVHGELKLHSFDSLIRDFSSGLMQGILSRFKWSYAQTSRYTGKCFDTIKGYEYDPKSKKRRRELMPMLEFTPIPDDDEPTN